MLQSFGKDSNINEVFKFWLGIGLFMVVLFTVIFFLKTDDYSRLFNIIGFGISMLVWYNFFRGIYQTWKTSRSQNHG